MLITNSLPDIINLIKTNWVSLIVAPTGTGKSLGIPLAVASINAKCFTTVPTRTAAISLYQRQVSTIKRFTFGYAAEGDIHYNDTTQIVYATSGHARKKMLGRFKEGNDLMFTDVLFVDEIHSGSLDNTLIISLWMYAFRNGIKVPRLVLASATPIPLNITPAPQIFTVKVPKFNINFFYLDRDIDSRGDAIYRECAKKAVDIHQNSPLDTGHILIFTPGKREVEETIRHINERDLPNAIVLSAYSSLKSDEIESIFKDYPGKRKIIVSTNIAEMSITIENIGHVVDSMYEKRSETTNRGALRLATHMISQDSATQRAGRTGRTRDGNCYRMCTLETYSRLERHRPPEIERVPLHTTVIELYSANLNPPDILTQVPLMSIMDSIQRLSKDQMIVQNETGVSATPLGDFVSQLPLAIEDGLALWRWLQADYPAFPGIVAVSIIDCYNGSYFWLPKLTTAAETDQYIAKYFNEFMGPTELHTYLNLWQTLMDNFGFKPSREMAKWCYDNSCNYKRIQELMRVVKQCTKNISRMQRSQVEMGGFTTQNVYNALQPILAKIYPVMTKSYGNRYKYQHEIYNLSRQRFSTSPEIPNNVIALSTLQIKDKSSTRNILSFYIPTLVSKESTETEVDLEPELDIEQELSMLEDLQIDQDLTKVAIDVDPSVSRHPIELPGYSDKYYISYQGGSQAQNLYILFKALQADTRRLVDLGLDGLEPLYRVLDTVDLDEVTTIVAKVDSDQAFQQLRESWSQLKPLGYLLLIHSDNYIDHVDYYLTDAFYCGVAQAGKTLITIYNKAMVTQLQLPQVAATQDRYTAAKSRLGPEYRDLTLSRSELITVSYDDVLPLRDVDPLTILRSI